MTISLQVTYLPNVTLCDYFIYEFKDVTTRNRIHKDQKKIGEYFHDTTLNKNLKSQARWIFF